MKYKIYKLINPQNDLIFYIGITTLSLQERLEYHLKERSRSYFDKKFIYLNNLKSLGLKPIIQLIKETDLKQEEYHFIYAHSIVFDLVNIIENKRKVK